MALVLGTMVCGIPDAESCWKGREVIEEAKHADMMFALASMYKQCLLSTLLTGVVGVRSPP